MQVPPGAPIPGGASDQGGWRPSPQNKSPAPSGSAGASSAWCRSNILGLGPRDRRCKSCRADHFSFVVRGELFVVSPERGPGGTHHAPQTTSRSPIRCRGRKRRGVRLLNGLMQVQLLPAAPAFGRSAFRVLGSEFDSRGAPTCHTRNPRLNECQVVSKEHGGLLSRLSWCESKPGSQCRLRVASGELRDAATNSGPFLQPSTLNPQPVRKAGRYKLAAPVPKTGPARPGWERYPRLPPVSPATLNPRNPMKPVIRFQSQLSCRRALKVCWKIKPGPRSVAVSLRPARAGSTKPQT